METLLIISLFLLFVIYAGYGIAIAVYNRLNPFSRNNQTIEGFELPEVAVLVAAYNEEDVIEDKIHNTLNLDYPSSKLKVSSDQQSDSVYKRKYCGFHGCKCKD